MNSLKQHKNKSFVHILIESSFDCIGVMIE